MAALALAFRKHILLGLDLARSIGGAGGLVRSGLCPPECFFGGKGTERAGRNYFRASAGIDYNFSPKIYGFIEYHFNSAGRSEAGEYLP